MLPSKIHACIESGKRVLFVGSQNSDVHLLASRALSSDRYCQVDVGDVERLVNALHSMELAIQREHDAAVMPSDLVGRLNHPTTALRAEAAGEHSAIEF